MKQNLQLRRHQEQSSATACNQPASCCSENYICSLQAHLSISGNELIKLKLEYEFRCRSCNKLSTPSKMAATNSVTIGASAAAKPTTTVPIAVVSSQLTMKN
uniref:Uncharacterized protein n=1 Tax=Romanomermis culicivorax TaxID=13658 RepID=A0A915JJ40_ROMCU